MTNQDYMLRAIDLARKGTGYTNPNPLVGAVIVKNGVIIGEGYHEKYGELHAERNAFASLNTNADGATLYVTLEPCCHHGKTPPCTDAIIEHGISKVFIGSRDPNPLVAGKGASILRAHGVEVIEDFMKDECDLLNPVFFHYITTKLPYVVAKFAMTADGKIATKSGDSKWITGEYARQKVQHMRHQYMAIMVGIGTVLADNPMLNVRIDRLKSPIRIICDSKLSIPLNCQIVQTAKQYKTIIAHASNDTTKINALTNLGLELLYIPDANGTVDLPALLKHLGQQGIDSIMVEGGGTLLDSLRACNAIQQVEVFIAPKLFGGANAKTPMQGIGIDSVCEALPMQLMNVTRLDEDVLLSYQVKRR